MGKKIKSTWEVWKVRVDERGWNPGERVGHGLSLAEAEDLAGTFPIAVPVGLCRTGGVKRDERGFNRWIPDMQYFPQTAA